MGVELRRFPRIDHNDNAQLEIPAKLSDPDSGWVTVPVVIRSVSCQGAGVDLEKDADAHVVPGTEVQLAMHVGENELTLPGRVVWAAGTHVGIRLRLGKADDEVRKAYAAWIVPLTNKEIARLKHSAV